jgi:hypothetical protein
MIKLVLVGVGGVDGFVPLMEKLVLLSVGLSIVRSLLASML